VAFYIVVICKCEAFHATKLLVSDLFVGISQVIQE